ncbi:MAG: DUF6452 family protein [Weeksellaceae bacterium]|nr:DUF6452 family protein [Weeksellaceae bacterium]
MRNLKIFWFVFIGLFLAVSCEEDDICIDGKTPRLLIGLNSEAPWANPDSLYVYRRNAVMEYQPMYAGIYTDSIALGLLLDEVDETVYSIGFQAGVENGRELRVGYTRELVFSSKACGFRYNYNDLTVDGPQWDSIILQNNHVWNEDFLHLNLYF